MQMPRVVFDSLIFTIVQFMIDKMVAAKDEMRQSTKNHIAKVEEDFCKMEEVEKAS